MESRSEHIRNADLVLALQPCRSFPYCADIAYTSVYYSYGQPSRLLSAVGEATESGIAVFTWYLAPMAGRACGNVGHYHVGAVGCPKCQP